MKSIIIGFIMCVVSLIGISSTVTMAILGVNNIALEIVGGICIVVLYFTIHLAVFRDFFKDE